MSKLTVDNAHQLTLVAAVDLMFTGDSMNDVWFFMCVVALVMVWYLVAILHVARNPGAYPK